MYTHKKKRPPNRLTETEDAHQKKAATYSPALHCSTIGDGGLNCSVRNGKRWDPAAITTQYGGHADSISRPEPTTAERTAAALEASGN